MERLGLTDNFAQPHRIIPETEIDRVRDGEISVRELALELGVSRWAIYLRLDYQAKTPDVRMRRWLVLFLCRIGLPCWDIAAALEYKTVKHVENILSDWGVKVRERKGFADARRRTAQRRWELLFLVRLGFTNKEIAEMTQYKASSVRIYRQMIRKGVLFSHETRGEEVHDNDGA
jgi:hypothetical protein